ncbi:hypothetical protein ACNA6I_01370 [Rossellomorea sp. FS2]|uniref:hypothetical protein n=1 Tax=Rossellomorea sp. FS2 TaxID=3391447 RepID=UPI003A4DCFCF
MTNLHYIADEQLGGVEREYAEVERKASVGDYVVNKCDEHCHAYILEVGYVQDSGNLNGSNALNDNDWTSHYLYANKYATLDPTGNVRIDGTVYRMVERKAAVGEKVLVTEIDHCEVSEIRNVVELDSDYFGVFYLDKPIDDWDYIDMTTDKYHVLEPKELFTCTYDTSKAIIAGNPPADELTQSADLSLTEADVRNNPRQVIDLIANLAGRLSKLESKVERLGTANQQAYDIVSRNVETWAQEIETIKARMGDAGRALTAEERREL